MGRDTHENRYVEIVSVDAGDAANGEILYYVNTKNCKRGNLQLNWTAGSGGGTIAVVAYGTMLPFKDEAAARAGDTGDVFQNVSTTYLGGASLTGDSMIEDSSGIAGCYQYMKFSVTVANKDAATEYLLAMWQTD